VKPNSLMEGVMYIGGGVGLLVLILVILLVAGRI
jgi:hypothetical protein